jgi:multidrug efflux pump subunit AcrB
VGEFVRVLIEAVVIVLGVSFVSLGLHTRPLRLDVRPGLVVALTIPLVLAVTFLFMNIFGIGLHKISLGALIIALGLLVDDAIIAVEMMVRKLEEGFSKMEAATFAYTSTAMPMLTGTLITAAGFLPVGLARSTVGEYTFAIFAVTALALVLSWLAAVYFTVPGLSAAQDARRRRPSRGVRYAVLRALPCAGELVRHVAQDRDRGHAGGVRAGAVRVQVRREAVLPDSSRPELMVELWMPEGTSFVQTEAEAKRFEVAMRRDKAVGSLTTFIGTGAPRFYLPLDQICRSRTWRS